MSTSSKKWLAVYQSDVYYHLDEAPFTYLYFFGLAFLPMWSIYLFINYIPRLSKYVFIGMAPSLVH